MSETEAAEWLKLLQGGANAGIICLVLIALKVAKAFLDALRDIRTELAALRAEVIAGQEDIKRGIVAIKPSTEPLFAERRVRAGG